MVIPLFLLSLEDELLTPVSVNVDDPDRKSTGSCGAGVLTLESRDVPAPGLLRIH